MATVIDSLLIELGLDASKYTVGQKKAIDDLRKFDDLNAKSNKASTKGAKEFDLNLGKVRNSLIAIGSAIVGVSGFKEFANQMIFGNAALGRTSAMLGMNARDLDAWGKAAEAFGGDSKGVQASLQNLEGGLAKYALGQGGEEVVNGLARLGVQAHDGKVNLIELGTALKRIKDTMGAQTALTLGSSIGLDQGTLQMLLEGGGALQVLHDKFYDLSGVTDQNIKDAQELTKQWAEMRQSGSALAQTLMTALSPAMKSVMDTATEALQPEFMGGWMATIMARFGSKDAQDALDAHLNPSNPAYKQLHPQAAAKSAGGAGGNMPRNMRNNNPGNIEFGDFARKHGATGSDGRFAIFPSLKAGQDAQASLLMSYMAGGNNTISKIVSKWAPSGENNTGSYISHVSRLTGIDRDTVLGQSDLMKVREAMAVHEGMVGARNSAASGAGGNTSTVSIQTVNVNKGAVDSNGNVNGIDAALNHNALINYSLTANQ